MKNSQDHSKRPPHQTTTCPTCGNLFVIDMTDKAMPFCSIRCKMSDLYRWMNEDVGLPCASSDEGEDVEPEAPPVVREWKFD